jgi:N-acetylglucosamine kinase-like BadF-type ATPase
MKWPWNTKLSTTCLASGQVAGAGRSGCGDIYGTAGEAAAVRSVMTAAGDALAAAGATRSQVRSAAFRLASVDWPEDGGFWDIELARQWPGLSRSTVPARDHAPYR